MCRGTLARKQYQRMLAARFVRVCSDLSDLKWFSIIRMIWGKYRKYKMRTYINTLQKTFK